MARSALSRKMQGMQLSNRQPLPVSQALAWSSLNDEALLRAAIPGCERLVRLGDDHFEAQLVATIGPLKTHFIGTLRVQGIRAPERYELHFEGQGRAGGQARGVAQVRLEARGDDDTLLHYAAEAEVAGRLAQLGSRLVEMAGQRLTDEFFLRFSQALAQRHGRPLATPPAAPAGRGLLRRLIGPGGGGRVD